MHRWTLLILSALLAGCREHLPSPPGPRLDPVAGTTAADVAASARLTLERAAERVIPAITDPAAAAALSSTLKRLSLSLEAGSASQSLALARMAREEIELYGGANREDRPRLEIIRLALQGAQ